MNLIPTLDQTRALARQAHAGQLDKAGVPYIEHVLAVGDALRPHGECAVMAGYLHDIVKDTGITLEDLRLMGYPEVVVEAVDAVSRRGTWPDLEPYSDLIERAGRHPLGCLVKLADNAHNTDPVRVALLPEPQTHAEKVSRARRARRYEKARVNLLAAWARYHGGGTQCTATFGPLT